jgi:glyoxylase I family protein
MTKSLNHVGLSVANLERAVEFYRTGFGMEIASQGAFDPETEGGRYAAILGLSNPRGRVALLKAGNLQLELFEFSHPSPERNRPDRPVCDHGITHFCVEVEDIDREHQRLVAAGASFHCRPLTFFGKATATYGRDPDGNVFELLQMSATKWRRSSATRNR